MAPSSSSRRWAEPQSTSAWRRLASVWRQGGPGTRDDKGPAKRARRPHSGNGAFAPPPLSAASGARHLSGNGSRRCILFDPLFVSHGSPLLAITQTPAHAFLRALGPSLPRPQAIVVASAHFEAAAPTVSRDPAPRMIYDFGGFPDALRTIVYPAPGEPGLAADLAAAISAAGLPVQVLERHGYDHGVWVPLSLMFPKADIPVVTLSIQPHADPSHHFALGEAIRPALGDDVLLIGSGSFTHNLAELRAPGGQRNGVQAAPPAWTAAFADWFAERLGAGDCEALLDYRVRAPHAVRNHPTDEHLLPLFVAAGAAGRGAPARRLHRSAEYGALMMDVYAFSAGPA